MYGCKICGKEFKIASHLSRHIKYHNLDSKSYYDKYLKKENEGTCLTCGKETKFENIVSGYYQYCSVSCISNNPEIIKLKNKTRKTIKTNIELEKNEICNICQKKLISTKALSQHIINHNISSKEYYDKYFKKENEGICQICEKETKFISLSKGYQIHCGLKCSQSSKERLIKFKDSYSNEKIEKAKEKRSSTNIEKYGKEIINQFDFPDKKEEYLEKMKILKNSDEWNKINIIKNLNRKKSFLEKYGGHPFQNKEIRNKIKQTHLNKFLPKIHELLKYLNLELLSTYNKEREIISLQCKNCGNIFETSYYNIYRGYGRCLNCFPKYKSKSEIELSNFIKSLNLNIIENSKDIIEPYELDIYIPDKNIAIEFDGLYWHSEKNINDKNYHLNKTESCKSKNIQLIHIFEDEWIFKQDIVKSRLKQLLNLNNNLPKIYARKCIIREISSEIKNEFLEKYHIQGKDNSSIKLGAFYNNELISIMTFSKGSISKGSKNVEEVYELNRFSSNSNYHIPGMASKLLSYFKKNYEWKEIYSYADRRWSVGNLYYKLGFEFDSFTQLNYWYINHFRRIHRFNLRKKPDEPKDIPESILRAQEGYYRIWDCGNLKFKMRNNIMKE